MVIYKNEYKHILLKFGEDMYYQTQIPLTFVIHFSDIGQCFLSAQKNDLENQKFILNIIYNKAFCDTEKVSVLSVMCRKMNGICV